MRKVAKLFGSGVASWGNILFLDPGVRNTGWAFWPVLDRMDKPSKKKLILPSTSGVSKAPGNVGWLEAVHDFQGPWIYSTIIYMNVKHLVIETAEVWSGDDRSMASATKGDIFKLSYLIGVLGHMFARSIGKKPVLISPREWKGTMPKDVMKRRLRVAIAAAGKHRQYSEHEADAVAMGVSVQKLL